MSDDAGNPRVFLLALGLLVGFVIGFVILLASLPVDTTLSDVEIARGNIPAQTEKRTFDFYKELPNQNARLTQVSVRPNDPLDQPQPEVAPKVIVPATRVVSGDAQNLNRRNLASEVYAEIPASNYGQESFFLQAGNYRSAQDAEMMRAQVLLMGLEAFIVTREEPSGGVGHRVRVGPFVDQSRMIEAKQRLRQGNVRYEIIRVTG